MLELKIQPDVAKQLRDQIKTMTEELSVLTSKLGYVYAVLNGESVQYPVKIRKPVERRNISDPSPLMGMTAPQVIVMYFDRVWKFMSRRDFDALVDRENLTPRAKSYLKKAISVSLSSQSGKQYWTSMKLNGRQYYGLNQWLEPDGTIIRKYFPDIVFPRSNRFAQCTTSQIIDSALTENQQIMSVPMFREFLLKEGGSDQWVEKRLGNIFRYMHRVPLRNLRDRSGYRIMVRRDIRYIGFDSWADHNGFRAEYCESAFKIMDKL